VDGIYIHILNEKKNEYSILHFEDSTLMEFPLTSRFCHEVAEHCALLGYCATSGGNLLPKFGESGTQNFGFLTPENGTDKLSRKVSKKLPLLAA
jgi:hypothetical protein